MSYLTIKIGAWAICGLASFVLLWDASAPPERKLQPGEQITTVLNSVVPPTIALTPIATTTTAVPKGCAQYVADAISAGWPTPTRPLYWMTRRLGQRMKRRRRSAFLKTCWMIRWLVLRA